MKRRINIIMMTVLAVSVMVGCNDLNKTNKTASQYISLGWSSFSGKSYSQAADYFRQSELAALADSSFSAEAVYGFGWSKYRMGQIDSASLVLQPLCPYYADAIVPVGLIKEQDLVAKTHYISQPLDSTYLYMTQFLGNPNANEGINYTFPYDTRINGWDVAAAGAQIAFKQKDYARTVKFIQYAYPTFSAPPDSVSLIMDQLDQLVNMATQY